MQRNMSNKRIGTYSAQLCNNEYVKDIGILCMYYTKRIDYDCGIEDVCIEVNVKIDSDFIVGMLHNMIKKKKVLGSVDVRNNIFTYVIKRIFVYDDNMCVCLKNDMNYDEYDNNIENINNECDVIHRLRNEYIKNAKTDYSAEDLKDILIKCVARIKRLTKFGDYNMDHMRFNIDTFYKCNSKYSEHIRIRAPCRAFLLKDILECKVNYDENGVERFTVSILTKADMENAPEYFDINLLGNTCIIQPAIYDTSCTCQSNAKYSSNIKKHNNNLCNTTKKRTAWSKYEIVGHNTMSCVRDNISCEDKYTKIVDVTQKLLRDINAFYKKNSSTREYRVIDY